MGTRGRHLRSVPTNRRPRRFVVAGAQVLLLLVALTVVGLPMTTGYEWRTVVSGSMVPLIKAGDVILAKPLDRAVEVGDVVVFADPVHADRDIVHRVVAIDEQGMVTTRGDANNGPDPWLVDSGTISGGLVLSIPKVGFVVEALTSKAGIAAFLVLPSLAIILAEIPVWYRFIRYGKEAFEPRPQGRHLVVA